MPRSPTPGRPTPDHTIDLEGHELVAVELGHADTDATTCRHISAAGPVVAGDAACNDVHLYLAEPSPKGRRGWITALDTTESLQPRAVIAGHKRPDAPATRRSSNRPAGTSATSTARRNHQHRASCPTRSCPATRAASTPAPCGARRAHRSPSPRAGRAAQPNRKAPRVS